MNERIKNLINTYKLMLEKKYKQKTYTEFEEGSCNGAIHALENVILDLEQLIN
jgi:hypothetical protein